jgi:hypothetical protein
VRCLQLCLRGLRCGTVVLRKRLLRALRVAPFDNTTHKKRRWTNVCLFFYCAYLFVCWWKERQLSHTVQYMLQRALIAWLGSLCGSLHNKFNPSMHIHPLHHIITSSHHHITSPYHHITTSQHHHITLSPHRHVTITMQHAHITQERKRRIFG